MDSDPRLDAGRRLLGHRLRDVRIRTGLTLSQAAALAGLSQSYISDVERGRTLPSLAALLGLADAYGTRVSTLLAGIFPFGSDAAPSYLPDPPEDARFRRSN
ncbi:helix-turn-helix domain-containing protein [Knoellia sp. CPCC 206435]|uniref:helix-turn-helix domain-containing protein n=1 Tax=Knoellia terrae TaxID=3404797 RepID=UPI003B438D1C